VSQQLQRTRRTTRRTARAAGGTSGNRYRLLSPGRIEIHRHALPADRDQLSRAALLAESADVDPDARIHARALGRRSTLRCLRCRRSDRELRGWA
jgi:hypothetical protein